MDTQVLNDEDIDKMETQQEVSPQILTDEDMNKIEIGETPQEQSGAGGLLTAFGMGAGGAATAYGAKKAFDVSAPARTKLSGNLINSIIKPRHKEYMFGKNPGKAIAQEGIWGTNIEKIGSKVDKRLNELTEFSKQFRSLSQNATKTVNLETMFEPLYDVSKEFVKAPLSNKANINKISNIIKDLRSNIPEGVNVREANIEVAYGIKKVIENMQKWDVQSSADDMLNKALKKVYHNIDSSIDVTLPELKSVNSRIANLISAKGAIRNQVEILSKQDPTALGNLLSLPIKATVGSTAVKSGLAKILAEKFGMVGNVAKGIGKVAKKGMPILGVATSIFDAMKFSQDPEAYMYQLEGGEELAPKGSEEREYQTGRII